MVVVELFVVVVKTGSVVVVDGPSGMLESDVVETVAVEVDTVDTSPKVIPTNPVVAESSKFISVDIVEVLDVVISISSNSEVVSTPVFIIVDVDVVDAVDVV